MLQLSIKLVPPLLLIWMMTLTLSTTLSQVESNSLIICCPNHFNPSIIPNFPPYVKFSNPTNVNNIKRKTSNCPQEESCRLLFARLPWGKTLSSFKEQTAFFNTIFNSTGLTTTQTPTPTPSPWLGIWSKKQITSSKSKSTQSGQKKNKGLLTEPWQKYNRIPGSFLLGNKAKQYKICEGLTSTQTDKRPFCLEAYILPEQLNKFESVWNASRQHNTTWILKGSSSSMSKRVYLISNWTQILDTIQNKGRKSATRGDGAAWIIQKYLTNPYLIRGKALELRVLILVTSTAPLRTYISYDTESRLGLANFTMDPTKLQDRCIHVRDVYKCPQVLQNWGEFYIPTNTLFNSSYFTEEEARMLRARIETLSSTILLRVSNAWWDRSNTMLFNRYNAYQVFSFDYLADEDLNLYLSEINTNPAFFDMPGVPGHTHSYTGPTVEFLNIVGYQIPSLNELEPILKEFGVRGGNNNLSITFDEAMYKYDTTLSKQELKKQLHFGQLFRDITEGNKHGDGSGIFESILTNLTADDVRLLTLMEDENSRAGPHFQRLIPGIHRLAVVEGNENRVLKYYVDLVYNKVVVATSPQSLYYLILAEAWSYKYGVTASDVENGIKRLKSALRKAD